MRVSNALPTTATVTVTRTDSTARQITLSVLPGKTVRYRSAPGEYSEAIRFAINHGTSRLSVTIAELRSHRVQLADSQLRLADIQQE